MLVRKTLAEKIISMKLQLEVSQGDSVMVPADVIFGTDGTLPVALDVLEKYDVRTLADTSRILFINDHFSPASDIASANNSVRLRRFAAEHNIRLFDSGKGGISHVLLSEIGVIKPYDIVVGADSHTCTNGALSAFCAGFGSTDIAFAMASGKIWLRVPETLRIELKGHLASNIYAKDIILKVAGMLGQKGALYKTVQFCGNGLKHISVAGRMTICNMVSECGAKNGIVPFDEITEAYLGYRLERELTDDYFDVPADLVVDLDKLRPQIAVPYSPSKSDDAVNYAGRLVDQVVIGSCTNGTAEDIRTAYKYLKGNYVSSKTRLIIIPGSKNVLSELADDGTLAGLVRSGAVIAPASCGACMGGHTGVLGRDEVGLYTTNRNYYGRNGEASAGVYLCSPAIAAYSAVRGCISVPEY